MEGSVTERHGVGGKAVWRSETALPTFGNATSTILQRAFAPPCGR